MTIEQQKSTYSSTTKFKQKSTFVILLTREYTNSLSFHKYLLVSWKEYVP